MTPQHPSARLSAVFRRPFDEQVRFFRDKLGNLVPTERWTDLWKEAHDRAFMVAGAAKADLLADLAGAVDKAIADGESIQKFRARFAEIVERHGWEGWTGSATEAGRAWRTRVIYTTNAATSYAAGRLAQLEEGGFPLWVYRHSDNVLHPRPLHLAWNGLTLPADDDWWRTHYPPNGWGCKCYVVGARDAAGARRLGGDPDKSIDPAWQEIDQRTKEPVGIDRGWGYMPGATSDLVREIERKMADLPAPLSAALSVDLARQEAIDWVVRQGKETGGDIEFAALITDRVVWRKRGARSYVEFDPGELDSMKGAVLVHNHPSSRSLSRADLTLAARRGLREIIAVGHDGSQYTAAEVPQDLLERFYDVAVRHTYTFLSEAIKERRISSAEADRWHDHAVNLGLARAGIITYRAAAFPIDEPDWVAEIADRIARNIDLLRRS
jgi:hypothetical protein